MRILAMTCLCVDVYDSTGIMYSGGNALNFAVACTREGGCSVSLLGAVGNDLYARHIRRDLACFPIDTRYVHELEGESAVHFIRIDDRGDRYFGDDDWHGGAFDRFRISGTDEEFIRLQDAVAITYNDPNFPKVRSLRKKSAFRLAVDFLDSRVFDLWENDLDGMDLYFISGDDGTAETLERWSVRYPETVFTATLGAAGSVSFRAGRKFSCPAVPVDAVVDTTGCGDAYQAAFTLSYLSGGDIAAAMKSGSIAASKVLAHIGGIGRPADSIISGKSPIV